MEGTASAAFRGGESVIVRGTPSGRSLHDRWFVPLFASSLFPFMSTERIGPYHVLEKIGSGGMGNVYLGKHEETGRVVAVKVLTASLAREPGFIERFNREIDAMRKLDNPHIVQLYESGVDGEDYYYAMEYVEGNTLMSVLRTEKRLPWQKTVEVAVQVCIALKAAHDAGIIHRDLKPSNLMIGFDGTVKLTDFGVAQVFASNRLTVTGGIIGTAEYMSPEQAQGKRATKQSDLYSLGAVMYAMITGRTPFTGSTVVEVIQKHKFGLFDRPKLIVPDLPQRIEDTICRLLEKDPDKRFPDAYVLMRHLEQVVRLEEYSSTGVTITGFPPAEGSSTTVAAGTMPLASVSPPQPGPATLMRSLLKAELSDIGQGNVLTALFNNVYFLVALLALVIAGGVWWLRPREKDPQELFDKGVAILDGPAGPEWLRARKEFFQPLLDRDPATWESSVGPYLRKIEFYEKTRPASKLRRNRDDQDPVGEPERILKLAQHYRQIGDAGRAEKTLRALKALIAGDPEQQALADFADQLLAELNGDSSASEARKKFLDASLARAEKFAAEGKAAEARAGCQSLIELYADDPLAASHVRTARALLEKIANSGASE